MKKKFYILAALLAGVILSSCSTGEKYRIDVTLEGAPEGMKVYLFAGEDSRIPADSTVVANGKFSFTPSLAYPQLCTMTLEEYEDKTDYEYLNNKTISVFVGKGTTRIEGRYEDLPSRMRGGLHGSLTIISVDNDLYREFSQKMDGIINKRVKSSGNIRLIGEL